MKTVQEFKDAGLVFVEGDVHSGVGPISFSWRKNTWVKPTFSGKVEVSFANGVTASAFAHELMWEVAGLECSIERWRPALDNAKLRALLKLTCKQSLTDEQVEDLINSGLVKL